MLTIAGALSSTALAMWARLKLVAYVHAAVAIEQILDHMPPSWKWQVMGSPRC